MPGVGANYSRYGGDHVGATYAIFASVASVCGEFKVTLTFLECHGSFLGRVPYQPIKAGQPAGWGEDGA